MVTLTYTSRATRPMTPLDLVGLLKAARDRNAPRGITGLLVYTEQSFMQQLEGEVADVDETFERIRADPRHDDLHIVFQDEIEARTYPDWSMGFAFPSPDELAAVLPGYEPRFTAPLAERSLIDAPTARLLLAMVAADAES